MAQIIVRPVADVTMTNIGYSSGTSAYPLVNEVTADGNTTTVSYTAADAALTVRLAAPDTSKIKTINSVTVYVTSRDSGYQDVMAFGFNYPSSGGTTFSTGTSSVYNTWSYTMIVNQAPTNFNLADLRVYYNMSSRNNVKSSQFLTQIYVVIDYIEKTITTYVKIDGVWKIASNMYVKIDGTWRTVAAIYDKISDVWHTG